MAEPLREAVSALTSYLVGDATMGETLHRVCEAALDEVDGAVAAGVSMTVEGRIGTYVFTHPDVATIDKVQNDVGDGPCIEAFETGRIVHVRSIAAPGPHPAFRAAAAAHGYRSVMSVPMIAAGAAVGTLNFYALDDDAFGDRAAEAAWSFAAHAAFLLLNAQAYWDARTLGENLRAAMEFRAVIEQAKGVLMGSIGCDADEAFALLRRQSQHQNIKLRDLAMEIVDQQRRPPRL